MKRQLPYDAVWFIKKFSRIPPEKWCVHWYLCNGQSCALGHCGERTGQAYSDESRALWNLLSDHGMFVHEVNDVVTEEFPQKTPRARILAALRIIAKKEKK